MEMREACVEDLLELKSYYELVSGGLMLSALDLEPDMDLSNELSAEYEVGLQKRALSFFAAM